MHFLTELFEKNHCHMFHFPPSEKEKGKGKRDLKSSTLLFFDERGILKLLRRKWVLQIRESEEEERLEI